HAKNMVIATMVGLVVGLPYGLSGMFLGAGAALAGPYLVSVLWNFFFSAIYKNIKFSEFVVANKEANIKVSHESDLQHAKVWKIWYALKSVSARAALIFPVFSGIAEFIISRGVLLVAGSWIAGPLVSLTGTWAAIALPADIAKILAVLHLDFTLGSVMRLGIMVMALNLKRIFSVRNELQDIILRKIYGLENTFRNDVRVIDAKSDIARTLKKNGLLNARGRPGLKRALEIEMGEGSKASWIVRTWRQFVYYGLLDIAAVVLTLSAPLLGFVSAYSYIRQFNNKETIKNPFYQLITRLGKEFYSGVFHMWLISMEIGLVIDLGNALGDENSPYSSFGGKYIKTFAEALEGQNGAIALGQVVVPQTIAGVNVMDAIYGILGAKTPAEQFAAEQEKSAKKAIDEAIITSKEVKKDNSQKPGKTEPQTPAADGEFVDPMEVISSTGDDVMDWRATAKEYIKKNEGWDSKIYEDKVGKPDSQSGKTYIPTIGYGWNIEEQNVGVRKYIPEEVLAGDRELTREEGDLIFEKIYPQYEQKARDGFGGEVFARLSGPRKVVLVDLAYNLRDFAEFIRGTGLKSEIAAGDFEAAARSLLYRSDGKAMLYRTQVGERAEINAQVLRSDKWTGGMYVAAEKISPASQKLKDYKAVEEYTKDPNGEIARVVKEVWGKTGNPVVPVVGTILVDRELVYGGEGVGLQDGPEAYLVVRNDEEESFRRIASDGTTHPLTDKVVKEVRAAFGDKGIEHKSGAQEGVVLVLTLDAMADNDHLKSTILKLIDQTAAIEKDLNDDLNLVVFADDTPVMKTDGDFVTFFNRVIHGAMRDERYVPVYNNYPGTVKRVDFNNAVVTYEEEGVGDVQQIFSNLAAVTDDGVLKTGDLIGIAKNPSKAAMDEQTYRIGLEIDGENIELTDTLDTVIEDIQKRLETRITQIKEQVENDDEIEIKPENALDAAIREARITGTENDRDENIAREIVFTMIERSSEFLKSISAYKELDTMLAQIELNEAHQAALEQLKDQENLPNTEAMRGRYNEAVVGAVTSSLERDRADLKKTTMEKLKETADSAKDLRDGREESFVGIRLLFNSNPINSPLGLNLGGGLSANLVLPSEYAQYTETLELVLNVGNLDYIGYALLADAPFKLWNTMQEHNNDGGLYIPPTSRALSTLTINATDFINDPDFDGSVQKKEFTEIVTDVDGLFKELEKEGYISIDGKRGIIQQKFMVLSDAAVMTLDDSYDAQHQAIYDVLRDSVKWHEEMDQDTLVRLGLVQSFEELPKEFLSRLP
ncbi:hypothetical protein KAR91_26355, partial [Candidatus Pacearchaeota archaeon]|nr:hypothetical protein [Candidatus Pacearchaeota archaeon]